MKKSMSIIIATAIATLGCTAAFAEQNILDKRQELISKLQKKDADKLEIGFFPYELEKKESFYWANDYLPLANYLSEETGYLVSLVPERRIDTFKNLIKAQRYKFIYVTSILAVSAQEIGYTPIVKFSNEVESVTMVKADSKYAKLEDLNGKHIAMKYNSLVGEIAKAKFKKTDLKISLLDSTSSKLQLVQKLDIGTIDAVVLRRTEVEDLMKEKPGKYKILNSNGTLPGFILLAHISATDSEVDKVKNAYLKIDGSQTDVMRGFGLTKSGKAFDDYNKDFLKEARSVLSTLEPDYGRYVYNPINNSYQEAFTLFVKHDSAESKPADKPVTKTDKK